VAITGEFVRWTMGPSFGGNLTWVVGGLQYQVGACAAEGGCACLLGEGYVHPPSPHRVFPLPLPIPFAHSLCPPPRSSQWESTRWTDNGEYQDLSGCDGLCSPMPYDVFPRKYMAVMLALGYKATNQSDYLELSRRAALVSLLLQSPRGEVPTGTHHLPTALRPAAWRSACGPEVGTPGWNGVCCRREVVCACVRACVRSWVGPGARSSQHQWNEAVSCVLFEYWAQQNYAAGNHSLAGAFRRASALSLRSLSRWKRPDGAWFVVKVG
jgi:hypothetical protein